MNGVARACAPFLLGFDCLAPVSNAVARRAVAAGFHWCGRYLDGPSPITPAERDGIFAAGLGIAPLTIAITGTPLGPGTGASRGAGAVQAARMLGIPAGVDVTADYESPHDGSDGRSHIAAFAAAVNSAGYGCTLYVGAPEDLDGRALYEMPPHGYWKGGGRIPEPDCGWMVLQLEPLDQTLFEGQRVDVDVTKQDYRGRSLVMWWGA